MTSNTGTSVSRVVVIGGGYAGVMAANRLRLDPSVDVTLINPRPDFVERIRLHQLVTGSDDAVVDFATVLHPDVRLVVDTAERIDAADRSVALASGGTVSYDHLIYAVGSNAGPSTVPGVGEFAYSVTEFEDAQRLRRAVDARPCDAPITVVGAGPTGLEMAAELAEQGRTVTLVGDAIGPYLSEPGWRAVAKRFRRLGVRTVEARVAEVRADAVLLADGRRLDSAVTVWTAGFAVPDLAARSGLSTDAIGRLRTDETLTSVDDDRIVAAGDAAAPSGQPLRMSCQAAGPLGAQAADTVLSRIAGDRLAPLDQAFAGQCISLGRDAGIIQLARRDDTAIPVFLSGRAAAWVKERVCRGTIWALAREARKPGSYLWLKGGRRPAQPALDEMAVS
jgi:NADH dehydrogenase FAD-containing subunit